MARKQKKITKKQAGDEKMPGFRKSFMFDDKNDPQILQDANKIMELSGEKTIRSAIRGTVRKALEDKRNSLEPKRQAS